MSRAKQVTKQQSWQIEIGTGVKAPVDKSCVGIAENLEPQDILTQALDYGFHHICQKNGHMYEREVVTADCLITSGESYLEFPAATILSPSELTANAERKLILLEKNFDSSNQKQVVLESIFKSMQAKGFSQTIADDVNAVADEFFTNAIYNAPFVDMLTHKNPGVSRHSLDINLKDGKAASIFLAQDDSRLVIGCKDPFGSLDLKKYLKKIRTTYQRGPAATMNFGPGGAGIGSYIIFNAGSSLYFGVWPGRATILCCVIPLGISNRRRVQMPKHLHWIQR